MPEMCKQKKILLVEDDVQLLEKFSCLLELMLHAKVERAADGFEAIEKLSAINVDVVISDIKMPKMDGLELLSCARKMGFTTPFVFLSAHTDKDTALRALKLGACDLLEKPFQIEDLIATINLKIFDKNVALKFDISSFGLKETPRRILEMVVDGLSNKQIGDELSLSEASIKYHVGMLLEQFHVKNRNELRTHLTAMNNRRMQMWSRNNKESAR